MVHSARLYRLLGERIRRVREAQAPPMTQGRLAEVLQLQRTSVTNIEAGRQKPSLDTLYRLCEHFSLAIGEFLPDVSEVVQAPSEPLIIGSQRIQLGAKTANLIHELRALHGVADANEDGAPTPQVE